MTLPSLALVIDPRVFDGCDSRHLSSALLSFLSRWEIDSQNLNIILLGYLTTPHCQVLKLLDAEIRCLDLTQVETSLAHLTKLTVFSFDRASFEFLNQQSVFY